MEATIATAGPAPQAAQESLREKLIRLRYQYWPDHWVGEILAKRWTETAIPVILLAMVVLMSGRLIGNFYSAVVLADTLRQAGEIGFIVLGLALVIRFRSFLLRGTARCLKQCCLMPAGGC